MKHKALHLPNLTPLRGLAALLIVLFHFDEILINLTFSKDSMFLQNCYLMVDLFFILSGFIMLHVYGENFTDQIKWGTYLNFLKARFARIYPLHVFTLLILIIVIYGSLNPYMTGPLKELVHNPKAIPTQLLLLHSFGIHDTVTWNSPSWSISAEWWAYMWFPILALLIARYKSPALLLMAVVVITLYVSIVYFLPRPTILWSLPDAHDTNATYKYMDVMWSLPAAHNIKVTYEFGYIRGLAGFMAGMITYHFFKNKILIQFLSKDFVGLVCIIALGLVMNTGLNNLICIPLFMVLVLCVVANTKTIHKICMFKPMQFLGEISYSIYMVHYLVILCIAMPMIDLMGFDYKGPGSLNPPLSKGLMVCAMFLLIVILVSSATYKFIEKPCRNWINKKTQAKPQIPTQ